MSIILFFNAYFVINKSTKKIIITELFIIANSTSTSINTISKSHEIIHIIQYFRQSNYNCVNKGIPANSTSSWFTSLFPVSFSYNRILMILYNNL